MDSTDTPSPTPNSQLPPTNTHEATSQPPKQKATPHPPTSSSRKDPSSWLTNKTQKLASWLATTEPSAQALRQYRKDAFLKAGISPTDPEPPHVKLHAPIGAIPADAIRPSSGPTPEAMARRKAAERREKKRLSGLSGHGGHGGHSGHSGRSSGGGLGEEQTSLSSSGSWSICRGQEEALTTFPYAGSGG